VTQEPASAIPCPKCAVAVPIGYVKCPRCHTAMPSVPSPRQRRESMREQLLAGGTAVPEPEESGFPWLLAAICAAAAITAIVWYVNRGGAQAATPGPAPIPAGAGSAIAAVGVARPGEPELPSAPTVDPRPRQRSEALAALDRGLATDRLWAQVSETGDIVVIRSGFCADKGIGARVDAAQAQLGALGYHAVRCLEKSGAPVWNRDLP
jgi:hypothetical protein